MYSCTSASQLQMLSDEDQTEQQCMLTEGQQTDLSVCTLLSEKEKLMGESDVVG